MKKLILSTGTILLFTCVAFAQEKTKQDASCCKKSATTAACCKKDAAKGSACCKQPGKTAVLRAAAVKPAKPAQPAVAVKPSGK